MGFEKWGDNWYLRIDDTILSNPSDEAKTLVTANLNTYQQNGGAYIRIGARVNGGQRTLFDTVNIIKKLNDQTGWTLGGDAALVGNAETGWQFYLGGQFQRSYYEAKIEASKLQMHFNLSDLAVGETVRVQLSDQAYGYGDFGIEKETAVCFSFERRAEGLHAYILRNGNEVYSKELTDFNFAENHVLEFVRKGNNWVPVLDGDEWEVNEIYDTFIEAMSINSADRTIVDFFSYTNRSIKNLKFTKKLSKNITVTVTAKDITDGSEVADADLQGGGNYVEGKVTVTAPTKSVTGYEFLGWYTGDDLNNFLSRKEIYTFEAKEDVNLVALYRMNSADSKKIVVIDKDTRKEQTYQVGEKITLSALSPDEGFQYWTNQFGLIVSRETVYTFKAVANDILTAHYEQDALKAMVVWESSYGQVMQRGVYDIYDTITEPSVPSILGYENGRWDKTAAEIKEAIRDGQLLITVKAVDYTSKAITYSITVSGGTFDGTEDKTRNYNVNDIVTVTADTAAVGQKFSHWIGYATIEGREAAKTISYESVYKFYAIQDYTVEGVFVSADETVEKQISAEIVQVKKDADNHTMSFVTMLTVPKDYKIVYGGILATTDSSKIDEATGKLNPATADYVRGSRKDDVKILRFTWNKSNVTDAQLWYVCPYLVYEDANGEVHEFIGVLGSYRLTNIGQAQDVE